MTDNNMSLDDVLNAWMLENPKPSYAALVKWSKRYPQYRQELTAFFSTWSRQRLLSQLPDPVILDEERLVARAVQYALNLAEKQGRILPDEKPVATLNPFDELVLTAIFRLHGEAWGANITDEVSHMSGKRVMVGTTFASLGRLERLGLIEARVADANEEPDHKGRRYFTATLRGESALAEAKETSRIVADFLGDFA